VLFDISTMTLDFDKLFKQSEEVFHTRDGQCQLTYLDIQHLVDISKGNPREKSRLCIHSSPDEPVHQMFISHSKEVYVRPHKHIDKSESMLILEGKADYLSFEEDGHIASRVPLGSVKSGDIFFQTTDKNIYHTIIIRSDWLIFLEVANGPFQKNGMCFADWSPPQEETHLGLKYLEDQIANLINPTD